MGSDYRLAGRSVCSRLWPQAQFLHRVNPYHAALKPASTAERRYPPSRRAMMPG
ncbi:hypothetical protein J2X72_000854 [Phyllobacterium sp. 1468]|nr:hypothetical protein [Phyllobacterium sp. 1468]